MNSESIVNKSQRELLNERFISAWINFTNSVKNLKSNEKSFQAWFATALIQEFGTSRVYREIHLDKAAFRTPLQGHKNSKEHDTEYIQMTIGNEFIPDVCISRHENIDTRHTSSRCKSVSHPRDMLSKMNFITEFKTGFSSKSSTKMKNINRDILKLGILSSLSDGLVDFYMCIIDDSDRIRNQYLNDICQRCTSWPTEWQKPSILLSQLSDSQWNILLFKGDTGWEKCEMVASLSTNNF